MCVCLLEHLWHVAGAQLYSLPFHLMIYLG